MCKKYTQKDDDLLMVNAYNITNKNYASTPNWTSFIPLLAKISSDRPNFREQNNRNEQLLK